MTVSAAAQRRGSARRQAERAVAQLHYAEVAEIMAAIEAGGDVSEIIRARQDAAADQAAVGALAGLRAMVTARLGTFTAEHGPWPGPLLTPLGVDLGEVDMWLYLWAGILYGVVLSQNAVDGQARAAGREIPRQFSLWDAQLPGFWTGDTGDGQPAPAPIGSWPPITTANLARERTGAA